jgi:hypothetical protein
MGGTTAGTAAGAAVPTGDGPRLTVTRRSLAPTTQSTVSVTDPAGQHHTLTLTGDPASGTATGSLEAPLPGVWQVSDGERVAYAAAAVANPLEIEDLRATDERLTGLARATGGSVHWVGDQDFATTGAPALRSIGLDRITSGRDWIGLPTRGAHITSAITTTPLLPDWLALAFLLGAVGLAWWRESV